MTQYNNLQKALIEDMDARVREAELTAQSKPHAFSRDFEQKMQRLIDDQKNGLLDHRGVAASEKKEYKQVRVMGRMMRRSVAVLLAAVLVLAMTVAAIAIAKPEIYYVIKEKITNWNVIPIQDNGENSSQLLVPVEPEIPEGYELIESNGSDISYSAIYSDGKDCEIIFTQKLAQSLNIKIDAEGENIYKTEINGCDAVISRHSIDDATIIVENGEYVFTLHGTCPFDVLYEMTEKLVQ